TILPTRKPTQRCINNYWRCLMTTLLKINGIATKSPSSMSVSDSDLFDGERNAKGDLVGDVIATKTKIELVWKYMTAEELADFMSLIDEFFFNVTYVDPTTNTDKTKMFYRSDRTY